MNISELKTGYTQEKINSEKIDFWLYFFARPLSWPFTWLFVKIGASAALVTYISIIAVLIGTVFLTMGNYTLQIFGIALFNFWIILDCVDGNIARYKQTFSKYGEYIDAVGGYFATACLFSSLGYLSFKLTTEPLYLTLGFVATSSSLLARLLYQKHKNVFSYTKTVIKPRDNRSSIPMVIAQNIGSASGLVLPTSLILVIVGKPELVVIIWCIINCIMLLYTLAKTFKRR